MVSQDTVKVLNNLIKIEEGLSLVYTALSKKPHFTAPVKKFWSDLGSEEIVHAKVFQTIREEANGEPSFQVEATLDRGQLRAFVDKAKGLLKQIVKEDLSETEAYRFGAEIEGELDEANFVKGIQVSDPASTKRLRRVEEDTKKHRLILINYQRGIR